MLVRATECESIQNVHCSVKAELINSKKRKTITTKKPHQVIHYDDGIPLV